MLVRLRDDIVERMVLVAIVGHLASVGTVILLGRMFGLEEWFMYHSVEWMTYARHIIECTKSST